MTLRADFPAIRTGFGVTCADFPLTQTEIYAYQTPVYTGQRQLCVFQTQF